MRIRTTLLILPMLLGAIATVAQGQVIERPPRSSERQTVAPRSTARPQEELTANFDVLAGFQDYSSPSGGIAGAGGLLDGRRSGTNGAASAGLSYGHVRGNRQFDADGQVFVNSLRDLGDHVLLGGRGGVGFVTNLTSRTNMALNAGMDYQPTFLLGVLAFSGSDAPTDQTIGVTTLRSVNGNASAQLTQSWTVRHRTTAGFMFSRSRFLERSGIDMDSRTFSLGHQWNFVRTAGLVGTYSNLHQEANNPLVGQRPLDAHSATVGLNIERNISRTRQYTLTVGGGATRAQTYSTIDNTPTQYIAPSVYGSARVDVGRTWAVSADARRDVSILTGLTQQSFLSTTTSLWVGGGISENTRLAFSGSYGSGQAAQQDPGEYVTAGGLGQLQYQLSDCCSLTTSYSYYEHRLRQVAAIPSALPNNFEGSSIRVGVSIVLPLVRVPRGRTTSGRN